ncbi:MAG: hypothetical protein ACYCZO_07835 [Daejeonella sp.]
MYKSLDEFTIRDHAHSGVLKDERIEVIKDNKHHFPPGGFLSYAAGSGVCVYSQNSDNQTFNMIQSVNMSTFIF